MRIVGLSRLEQFQGLAAFGEWLSSWLAELKHATWKHPGDVVAQFPSVQTIGSNRFVFQCAPINGVVEVQMAFAQGVVLIVLVAVSGETHGN
jgi:mRNA-degrading endonuclease HigB of HigAB toxin-antitoxin module